MKNKMRCHLLTNFILLLLMIGCYSEKIRMPLLTSSPFYDKVIGNFDVSFGANDTSKTSAEFRENRTYSYTSLSDKGKMEIVGSWLLSDSLLYIETLKMVITDHNTSGENVMNFPPNSIVNKYVITTINDSMFRGIRIPEDSTVLNAIRTR